MRHQIAQRVLGDGPEWELVDVAGPLDEISGQQRNVVPVLTQRRERDPDDVQPVIQVFAELVVLDQRREVGVGGRDDPRVEPDRQIFADPLDLALLERAGA